MVLSSAIVCDHDRRIADDRRSSFHMIADDRRPYCDLRSEICDPRSYGNQPLDRTWFYLLRSSAITNAGSQTIADLIAICDHMETSLKSCFVEIHFNFRGSLVETPSGCISVCVEFYNIRFTLEGS